MIPTHYDLLGIDSAASVDEIRRAFRREIAKYHPDKVQHSGTSSRILRLSARRN